MDGRMARIGKTRLREHWRNAVMASCPPQIYTKGQLYTIGHRQLYTMGQQDKMQAL